MTKPTIAELEKMMEKNPNTKIAPNGDVYVEDPGDFFDSPPVIVHKDFHFPPRKFTPSHSPAMTRVCVVCGRGLAFHHRKPLGSKNLYCDKLDLTNSIVGEIKPIEMIIHAHYPDHPKSRYWNGILQ